MYKKIKIEKTKEQITIILNNKKTVLNKRGMTALPYQESDAPNTPPTKTTKIELKIPLWK
jgi:hypothetical protein